MFIYQYIFFETLWIQQYNNKPNWERLVSILQTYSLLITMYPKWFNNVKNVAHGNVGRSLVWRHALVTVKGLELKVTFQFWGIIIFTSDSLCIKPLGLLEWQATSPTGWINLVNMDCGGNLYSTIFILKPSYVSSYMDI